MSNQDLSWAGRRQARELLEGTDSPSPDITQDSRMNYLFSLSQKECIVLWLHRSRDWGQIVSRRKDSFPMLSESRGNDGFAIHRICLPHHKGPRNRPSSHHTRYVGKSEQTGKPDQFCSPWSALQGMSMGSSFSC